MSIDIGGPGLVLSAFHGHDRGHHDVAADRHGIRAYVGVGYRSGRWLTRNGRSVEYEWSDDGGWDGFRRALELCEGGKLLKTAG